MEFLNCGQPGGNFPQWLRFLRIVSTAATSRSLCPNLALTQASVNIPSRRMANPTGLSPATDLGGPDRDSAGISRNGSAAPYGISPPSGLSACEPKQRITLAVMIGCVDARPHWTAAMQWCPGDQPIRVVNQQFGLPSFAGSAAGAKLAFPLQYLPPVPTELGAGCHREFPAAASVPWRAGGQAHRQSSRSVHGPLPGR
jgi:hypothetical protein